MFGDKNREVLLRFILLCIRIPKVEPAFLYSVDCLPPGPEVGNIPGSVSCLMLSLSPNDSCNRCAGGGMACGCRRRLRICRAKSGRVCGAGSARACSGTLAPSPLLGSGIAQLVQVPRSRRLARSLPAARTSPSLPRCSFRAAVSNYGPETLQELHRRVIILSPR